MPWGAVMATWPAGPVPQVRPGSGYVHFEADSLEKGLRDLQQRLIGMRGTSQVLQHVLRIDAALRELDDAFATLPSLVAGCRRRRVRFIPAMVAVLVMAGKRGVHHLSGEGT